MEQQRVNAQIFLSIACLGLMGVISQHIVIHRQARFSKNGFYSYIDS